MPIQTIIKSKYLSLVFIFNFLYLTAVIILFSNLIHLDIHENTQSVEEFENSVIYL